MTSSAHRIAFGILSALILIALLATLALRREARTTITVHAPVTARAKPTPIEKAPPVPTVEPSKIYALDTDRARALNATIPISQRTNPAASPFRFAGGAADLARATDCLASAQIYEAGDDAVGEQAVAQVVLNRVRHPAFPKSVCGVVFQGQERRTGCQFTFTCDGALARTPSPAAWTRAQTIAKAALAGAVFRPVGLATHYHTDWVVPYWSASLDKTAKVGTHLFFRWTGWWGTPPAFQTAAGGAEPVIGRIARLSLAHRDGALPLMAAAQAPADPSGAVPIAGQVMPPANKSWTPAPAVPLPVGVRRSPPVEMVEGGARREVAQIALGPVGR
jgi:spore germination cell wall hydrolase CwlJ-like protein